MATINDIATRLKLSTSTVSRALCDNKGVSEETRALVKQVAQEMNYSINRFAKNLVTKTSYTIGFMIPDISDSFFSKAAYGVEEALKGSGFSLAYTNVQRDEEHVLSYLRRAVEYRYDGVFVTLDSCGEQLASQLDAMSIPVVSLRRKSPPTSRRIPYVDSDHMGGMEQILKHLLALGHTRLGFIGFDTAVGKERTRCYREAAQKYGVQVHMVENYSFHNADIRVTLGYKSAQALLEVHPQLTAIVAADDQLALGVLQYTQEHGIAVPDRLNVTGYDDRDIANLYCVKLTTARQQLSEIGYQAGRMMLEMIERPGMAPESVEVKTKLCVRKTTGVKKG